MIRSLTLKWVVTLILRGACIAVGAAAIERFSWVFYVFGIFLVYTAVQLLRGSGEQEEFEENLLIRQARRLLPVASDYDGSKLLTIEGGRRVLTPMMIVFLAIGSTDLLFAVDSIPAIFGLTQDPFVVFTATLFALMGLRQLYFLLGGLLDRLVYLSVGLSVILGFIGVKMILEALHTNELGFVNGGHPVGWAPDVPTALSLGVIVVVLAVTTAISLLSSEREPAVAADAAVDDVPGAVPTPAQARPSEAGSACVPGQAVPGPDPGAAGSGASDPGAAGAGATGAVDPRAERPRPEPARPDQSRPEPARPRQPHPPGARALRTRPGAVPGPASHQAPRPGQVRD